MPSGPPAGTGILRAPGVPAQEVPLMSIQKDEPAGTRVEVGPITPPKGVADVLMGSIGIVFVAVVASVLLGAVLGGVLVLVKHRLGWGGPDKDAEQHISLHGEVIGRRSELSDAQVPCSTAGTESGGTEFEFGSSATTASAMPSCCP